MTAAEYDHITKVFKERNEEVVAVDDLNIEVRDGEFLVLVGPSGCGKSTTLRLLAGLDVVSDGEVYIRDEVVNDKKPKDRDIAMVFQNYALYPDKTVEENMRFGLEMTTDLGDEEIDERVKETADMLDIMDLLDRRPNALSGGQKQRAALGRAIVREPEVFLLDEPLSNLDAKLRTQMRTELQQLHEQLDVATIYVTHDQTEAMSMGDRIAVLNNGKLQQIGTPLDLYQEPDNVFVAGFIGSPSMNFIEMEYDPSSSTATSAGLTYEFTDEQSKAIEDSISHQQITLGIRPGDIQLAESIGPRTAEATIEVFEPMGEESLFHLDVGGHEMTASIEGDYYVEEGKKIKLLFPNDSIHVFDTRTEEAVFNQNQTSKQLPESVTLSS